MKVQFSSVSGADGYQVVYSTNKNFRKAKKKILHNKKKILSGLRSGKVYYVKVRAFQKQNGARTYGAYSGAKKIRVK